MGRRGRGEGSISQRADGRWVGRVDLGRGATGRRKRKTVYAGTRAAVAKELNKLLGRGANGTLLDTSTPLLKVWLADWYATHKTDWRPGTQRVYQHAIDRWIVPGLGTIRLDALKPLTVQRWVNQHTANGPRRMFTTSLTVLRSALSWAMTQQVIAYNPAALVKAEKPKAAATATLSLPHALTLLDACEGHPLGAVVAVSLLLGLRVGEACGLRWTDLDLAAGTLKVRQQIQPQPGGRMEVAPLKTANSRRTLDMPQRLVGLLTARKTAQLEDRLRAGERWRAGELVFTNAWGGPLSTEQARGVLAGLLAAEKLPVVRYHALRHTAATLLLADGAPLVDVSKILGHGSIATTADLYGHLVPDITAGAAARLNRLFASKG